MTAEEAYPPGSPLIVLVGGVMTLADGSRLDSRQEIEGDPESRAIRRSMARSWLWWMTTSSLVMPILDERGPDAYALLIGERSVIDLRRDGGVRRIGLGVLLQGGVDRISVTRTSMDDSLPAGYEDVTTLRAWNGESLGPSELNAASPEAAGDS